MATEGESDERIHYFVDAVSGFVDRIFLDRDRWMFANFRARQQVSSPECRKATGLRSSLRSQLFRMMNARMAGTLRSAFAVWSYAFPCAFGGGNAGINWKSRRDSLASSDVQDKTIGEFVDLVASKLGSGRAIHPETAISTGARLAGSLLLRSFSLGVEALEPGAILISTEAKEKGPLLIRAMVAFLSKSSVSLDEELMRSELVQRGAEPNLTVMQSLSALQHDALEIVRTNGLGLEDAALCAAVATGFMVKECAATIGAVVGFNVAVLGFIEGCKTVPPVLSGTSSAAEKKRPWYKIW